MFMHARLFRVLQRRYVCMWHDLRQANKSFLCQTGDKNPRLTERRGKGVGYWACLLACCFAAGSVNIWTRSYLRFELHRWDTCWLRWLAGFSILSLFCKGGALLSAVAAAHAYRHLNRNKYRGDTTKKRGDREWNIGTRYDTFLSWISCSPFFRAIFLPFFSLSHLLTFITLVPSFAEPLNKKNRWMSFTNISCR